ncbi:hypothetical protein C3B55_00598 [Candidatus Pseudomonas adelgestsugas]|uniref:Uncharacterized protein n=1 Tax=Candidatus Pseudomonas adelgestsugas TaxID=1302376 RepID=A0ABX5R9R1_9PSED|nr:hypothetical protein C3B55_00598 [Candidatus Pseudomonas adelgestsugas]
MDRLYLEYHYATLWYAYLKSLYIFIAVGHVPAIIGQALL